MAVLSSGFRVARKPHFCDGWRWLDANSCELPELKQCEGIKAGDEYYFENNTENLSQGNGTFKCCRGCLKQSEENDIPMCDQ